MFYIEEGIGLKLQHSYILVNRLQLHLLVQLHLLLQLHLQLLLQVEFQLVGGLVDCNISCLL